MAEDIPSDPEPDPTGAAPPAAVGGSGDPLPGQHPDVTPDFVFGQLAASAEGTRALARALSGVQHQLQITPLRPQSGAAVLVTATTGPEYPARAAWLYYTTDGSRPAGHAGGATNGTALALAWRETRWSELLWDYLSVWQGEIPPQPSGTTVRYQIEAVAAPGSGLAPVYADADPKAAGGLAPVFAYLVDAPTAPDWVRGAVFYHVFPDRFEPGSGHAWREGVGWRDKRGGTLRGITERLDYIRDLGADALWLSPIFASPTYHRYDPSDLYTVDPVLGTNDDLRTLVEAAHARGIRVLLDLVPNHLSNRHPFFVDAQTNRASPYHDWFTWHRWPDEYAMFYTSKGMPRLNHENPEARAYFLAATRYWLEQYDVDGYRLDHVLGPSHDFWTDYYRTVKAAKPDSFSVGEATHGPGTMRSYEGRMDGALDFQFLTMIRGLLAFETIRLSGFDRFLEQNRRFYTPGFATPTFLDNHDMNRFLWVAKGDTRKLRVAAALQCTLAPPPIIYYGTEAGIRQQADARNSGWGGDAQARGLMLWGADQDADLLAYYRRLIALRRAHPAIWQGTRRTVHLDEAARTYAYTQTGGGLVGLLIVLNLGAEPRSVPVPLAAVGPPPAAPRDLLNAHPVEPTGDGLRVLLPPYAAALIPLTPGG